MIMVILFEAYREMRYKTHNERVDCVVHIYNAYILLFVMLLQTIPITGLEKATLIVVLKNDEELSEE